MPREGSILFGDLVGKLEYLDVVCDKCDRRGRYSVAKLIESHGADAKLTEWRTRLIADCPRRASMSDPCGAHSPDLRRVF